MRITLLGCLLLVWGAGIAQAEKPKPLKALLITGGCCHDYTKQKVILTEGISQRANVQWTIVQEGGNGTDHKVSAHEKKDWAQGYDIVVHNECFAGTTDLDWIHNITDAHKAGVPGLVIHCAMHCYRGKTDQWFKFCGVRSHGHGPQLPIEIDLAQLEHPIVKGMPAHWKTVPTEMYAISEVYDSTTPLAVGRQENPKDKKGSDQKHACIWVSQFGKARVFGTTLGHHNKEFEDPAFLDFVAKGLLWACGKLGDDGKPLPGYEGTGVKQTPVQPGPEPTPAPPKKS
jgi:type 1 glutamine amidotransferase